MNKIQLLLILVTLSLISCTSNTKKSEFPPTISLAYLDIGNSPQVLTAHLRISNNSNIDLPIATINVELSFSNFHSKLYYYNQPITIAANGTELITIDIPHPDTNIVALFNNIPSVGVPWSITGQINNSNSFLSKFKSNGRLNITPGRPHQLRS